LERIKIFKYLLMLFLTIIFLPLQSHAANDSGLLWLVNKDNRLSSSFEPVELGEHQGIKLHSAAKDAFMQMLKAMQSDGIHGLRLQSAYRTFNYQHTVFNKRIKELMAKGYSAIDAEIEASMSVQPPGASEHQLGLALDVTLDGSLTESFGETRAGKWLEERSHEYGFIIRYPSKKTDVTQIVYEPWHLRYVGIPHSLIINNLDLTLEEYLSYIKEVEAYIYWDEYNEYYLVTYSEALPVELSHEVVDISSLNKKSGYIITMRKGY